VLNINIPAAAPTTQELAALRCDFCQLLRELAKEVMKREFELMNVQDAQEMSASVRRTAEELSAAAATWARVSDSMKQSWRA